MNFCRNPPAWGNRITFQSKIKISRIVYTLICMLKISPVILTMYYISFLILDVISRKQTGRHRSQYKRKGRWMRVLIFTQSLDERIRNIPVEYRCRRWHDFNALVSNIFHPICFIFTLVFLFQPRVTVRANSKQYC